MKFFHREKVIRISSMILSFHMSSYISKINISNATSDFKLSFGVTLIIEWVRTRAIDIDINIELILV